MYKIVEMVLRSKKKKEHRYLITITNSLGNHFLLQRIELKLLLDTTSH